MENSNSKLDLEIGAGVYFCMWLFTIGFSGLSFGQGIAAIVIWPYYLGETVLELLT